MANSNGAVDSMDVDDNDFNYLSYCNESLKNTNLLFKSHYLFKSKLPPHHDSIALRIAVKANDEYAQVKDMESEVEVNTDTKENSEQQGTTTHKVLKEKTEIKEVENSFGVKEMKVSIEEHEEEINPIVSSIHQFKETQQTQKKANKTSSLALALASDPTKALAENKPFELTPPDWHAPWELMRVISGHVGWVRCAAVDVSNEWFCTGGADRTIMVWDLASGRRKVTLTGHIHTVRGLAISDRHPYLFSAGEDKMVRCWDLEYNKTIRSYHGHLSGVYCCALHPTIDVLITGGRDSTARVWDIRTKAPVHVLSGHSNTVASIVTQATDPQVITSSMDSTIRCWDLAAGKSQIVLTHHKKSVRALVMHPTEYMFASASPDNIKKWQLPRAQFLQNFSGHRAIVNTLAINRDNVLVSGGDNGSLRFWDWKSGYCFQQEQTIVQPGSQESEAGIFHAIFDRTGSRLITCEADKTIKIWKENEEATPVTHPINWKPKLKRRRY